MVTKSADLKDFWTKLTVSPAMAHNMLLLALESGTTAMMWGNYGVGKTSVVYQLKETLKNPQLPPNQRFDGCVVINPSQTDIIDFKLPIPKKLDTGEMISQFAYSELLPREGRHIIFVDEINTAPQSLQPTLYSLILEGRIGNYKLPDGCFRVAAGNREEDQCAAQPMSNALKDRLNLHMFVQPDKDSWGAWANLNRIRPEIQAWVQFSPHSSLQGHQKDDPTGGCTPRSLEALSKTMDTLHNRRSFDPAMESRLITGTIGQAAASEFEGFLEIYRSQISLEEIIKSPTKAEIPKETSLLFCVAFSLAERMTVDNIDAVFKYLSRLPQSYTVLAIQTAMARNKEMCLRTPQIRDFITKNLHVII